MNALPRRPVAQLAVTPLVAAAAPSNALTWGPEVNLSDTPTDSEIGLNHRPMAVTDDGVLHAVWAERGGPNQTYQVRTRRLEGNGAPMTRLGPARPHRPFTRPLARLARLAPLALLALAACLDEPASTSPPLPPPGGALPEIPARVLIVNGLSETLSSLDPETGTMTVQAATIGAWPNRVRPWIDGLAFLVTCSGDNSVQILNSTDLSFRQEIDLGPGSNPWLAEPTGATSGLVSSWLAGEVRPVLLGEARALASIPVAPGPEGIATDGTLAWIACTNFQGAIGEYGPGQLVVVDLEAGAVVETIEVGRNPQDVLVASDGRVHVLCTGTYGGGPVPESGRVHVFDPVTRREVGSVALGGSPGRFVQASSGIVWVAGSTGGIRRYDAITLDPLPDPIAPEFAGPGWAAIDEDPGTGTLWAVNFDLDLAVAIAPGDGALIDAWRVGDGPVDVCVLRP